MKVLRYGAERSLVLILTVVLLLSVIVVVVGQHTINNEIIGLKHRISVRLGLSRQYTSGRLLLGSIANMPSAAFQGRYPPEIESLYIDVKFAKLQMMREDQLESLERGLLVSAREVNAIVRHDGAVYRAEIRLKGDFPGHWRGQNRWSLRIKLKDGASIWGMSVFSLHKPIERQYPFDQSFQEIMRNMGNLSPRQTFFRVSFNGDNWGVMNAEEHISKEMIELQGRKASIITKFGNNETRWMYEKMNEGFELPSVRYGTLREMQPFGEKSVFRSEYLTRLYSYVNKVVLDYTEGRIPYDDVFDVDSYSRTLLAAVVWNNIHTLGNANSRHYLNPYTLRLEPITTDQRAGTLITQEPPDRFSFTNEGAMSYDMLPEPYLDLLMNQKFWERLESNFPKVLAAFSNLDEVFKKFQRYFPLEPLERPAMFATKNIMYVRNHGTSYLRTLSDRAAAGENGGLIDCCRQARPIWDPGQRRYAEDKDTIETFEGEYPKHFIARLYSGGILEIENLLLEPVRLKTIWLKSGDDIRKLVNTEKIIPPSNSVEPTVVRIQLSVERLDTDQRLFVESSLHDDRKTIQINGSLDVDVRNPLLEEKSVDYLLGNYPFFSLEDEFLHVEQGIWRVNEPLVLPGGVGLSIEAGTTVEFCRNCYIIVKGPIRFAGTEMAPVRLLPQDQHWKGLYVLEAEEDSRIAHVEIFGASEVADSALALTGGVVFYRSDIVMENVRIIDAQGEDALNIVHSNFVLRDLAICNARSDGFDADFTRGEIRGVEFCKIGGDALDISGSEVDADDFVASDIRDKAVSVGERSHLSLVNADLKRVGTGIVSKDSSTVEVSGSVVTQYDLAAAMVYQKKSFYGPAATLSLQEVTVDDDADAFVAQTGNVLRVDGVLMPTRDLDVDRLYQTGSMRK